VFCNYSETREFKFENHEKWCNIRRSVDLSRGYKPRAVIVPTHQQLAVINCMSYISLPRLMLAIKDTLGYIYA